MPYGYNGANMINQLYRQKDNIENMIAQYAQQPPVQNIINTSGNTEYDVKFLNQNEWYQRNSSMKILLFYFGPIQIILNCKILNICR